MWIHTLYAVQFRVKMKDGSHILMLLMFVNVLQQITGNIQKGTRQQKDILFLQFIGVSRRKCLEGQKKMPYAQMQIHHLGKHFTTIDS